MNKIKVGVAGLGFIGPAHIEALLKDFLIPPNKYSAKFMRQYEKELWRKQNSRPLKTVLRELVLCERILESNEKQQWVKVE